MFRIFVLMALSVFLSQSVHAQCASVLSALHKVSDNGNGTGVYNISYIISGWNNNLKSYQITVVCSGANVVSCTALPASGTVSGTTANFTCTNAASMQFTISFGTSAANCGGGGACVQSTTSTLGSALPVKWVAVNASINKQQRAELNWQVQEYNVNGYTIEKSTDAKQFKPVALVISSGDGLNNYRYTDEETLHTTAFYRIKQTDVDGVQSYSSVLKLGVTINKLQLFPNPVKNIVSVSGAKQGTVLQITDSDGRTLKTIIVPNSSFTIDLSSLSAGIYFLKDDNGSVQKMIKK